MLLKTFQMMFRITIINNNSNNRISNNKFKNKIKISKNNNKNLELIFRLMMMKKIIM